MYDAYTLMRLAGRKALSNPVFLFFQMKIIETFIRDRLHSLIICSEEDTALDIQEYFRPTTQKFCKFAVASDTAECQFHNGHFSCIMPTSVTTSADEIAEIFKTHKKDRCVVLIHSTLSDFCLPQVGPSPFNINDILYIAPAGERALAHLMSTLKIIDVDEAKVDRQILRQYWKYQTPKIELLKSFLWLLNDYALNECAKFLQPYMFREAKINILCIEGTVCTGKSTLVKQFTEMLRTWLPDVVVDSCLEPDEMWTGILKHRIEFQISDDDPHPLNKRIAKAACDLMMQTIELHEDLEGDPDVILIFERSPIGIHLLWNNVERNTLAKWCKLHTTHRIRYYLALKNYDEKRFVVPDEKWMRMRALTITNCFELFDYCIVLNHWILKYWKQTELTESERSRADKIITLFAQETATQ